MTNHFDPVAVAALDALAATDVQTKIPAADLDRALSSPPFIALSVPPFPNTTTDSAHKTATATTTTNNTTTTTSSLFNLRDIGAVPGSAIPIGRIYRCGTLSGGNVGVDETGPETLAWLAAARVRRVFDLRGDVDRAERLSVAAGSDGDDGGGDDGGGDDGGRIENIWRRPCGRYPLPSLDDFADSDAAEGDRAGLRVWGGHYLDIAMAYRPIFRAVLEFVRDWPGETILIHCTVGRDRTAVLAGLLHHLAGSPPDAAERDYMLSRIGTEAVREELLHMALMAVGGGGDEKTAETQTRLWDLVQLRPARWRAFVGRLERRFGGSGWDGYMTTSLGFSGAELERIRENLRI